ncbi:MAG: Hypoxanthine phosphoribosyltransferase [Desulfovibrio sp.]
MHTGGHTLRCIHPRETVETRIRELAAAINAAYEGKPLVVVCVLKGAFMFFSDLVKCLTVSPQLDFVRLASYGNGMETSRSISFTKDLELSLAGKHVLLVEDVVDTGHTMDFLLRQLKARGAASIRIAALVDKTSRREVPVDVAYVGFTMNDEFIVGYGLDYAENYRELPAIWEVLPDTSSKNAP